MTQYINGIIQNINDYQVIILDAYYNYLVPPAICKDNTFKQFSQYAILLSFFFMFFVYFYNISGFSASKPRNKEEILSEPDFSFLITCNTLYILPIGCWLTLLDCPNIAIFIDFGIIIEISVYKRTFVLSWNQKEKPWTSVQGWQGMRESNSR